MLKQIAGNTLAQLVAKFVGAGLTFLTTAIIIRLSGPALFGDLTKALALIAIGFTALDFGLNATIVRALGQSSHPRLLMSRLITLRLFLSLFAVLTLNLLVFILPGGYTPAIKAIFWVGSLSLIFQGLYTSLNAWFQFQENYWRSTLATITGTIVGTLLTIYFAFFSPTLLNFLLSTTLGYLLMAAISISLGRNIFALTFSLRPLATLLRDSSVLGGILLLSVMASKLDTVILGVFRDSAEVGQYGFSYRIFDVLLVFPVFIMNSLYPRLIKLGRSAARRLIRSSLLPLTTLGTILAVLAWFLSPALLLVKPDLYLSVHSLRLLVLFLPLFFLTAPLMWQYVALHQEKILFKIYLLAALGNGLLNLSLVPRFGYVASALLTGATELFILICLLYYSRKSLFIDHEITPAL